MPAPFPAPSASANGYSVQPDDGEGFGVVVGRQASVGGVLAAPVAHVGGEGFGVAVLAGVGHQGGDLLVDGVGDVDPMVAFGVLHHPEFADVPRLLGQLGEGVRVAGG